jgi:uncharacterized membrane protein YebE (DUF533 family)
MEESTAHLLQSLIAMASADGRIGKREQRFIELVMSEFEVHASTVQYHLDRCRNKKIFPNLPDDPTEKRFLLTMLVKLAAVDGFIDPGEQQMLDSIALHCRIDLDELNGIVSTAVAKVKARTPRKHKSHER